MAAESGRTDLARVEPTGAPADNLELSPADRKQVLLWAKFIEAASGSINVAIKYGCACAAVYFVARYGGLDLSFTGHGEVTADLTSDSIGWSDVLPFVLPWGVAYECFRRYRRECAAHASTRTRLGDMKVQYETLYDAQRSSSGLTDRGEPPGV